MLKIKKKLNSKLKTRIMAGVFGLMSIVLVGSILANVFATASDYFYDSANVSLNGVDGGTAYMYLRTAGGGTFYTMQGDFSINETNDENGYIALQTLMAAGSNGSTSVVNFDSDGFRRLLHTDSNYDGNEINANNPIMIAVYSVDKDTPAGDYTVSISNAAVVGGTSGFEGEHLPTMNATIHVTRDETPATKPSQVVTFRDNEGNVIGSEGISKFYGDEDFVVTKEVTTGDGAIRDYHPDDDGTGSIAYTIPQSDLVGVGVPGDVDICAWVDETENYAETKACYTVHVSKRPLDIVGVTIENKVFDGTTDATVTNVDFEDRDLDSNLYTATASFDNAEVGENKAVHVTVNLTGGAEDNYVLNADNFNTTKAIQPYHLVFENVELLNGNTYGYNSSEIEPEVRVKANTFGGITTLVDGRDYEVNYSNNVNVGTGHVSVIGKGNYTTGENPIIVDFTIEQRGINNENLSAPNSIIEGHILSPNEISVNVDGVDLVRCTNDGDTNCDYVLEISGENDGIVGHSIHVAVNGRNNYTGVGVKDINIVAKAEQTVAFNDVTGNIEKVYGDEDFTYIATTNGDGAISYSSNNESVATVDANGKVTIHGVGEANIIATAAETDTYAEGTASYHLIVAKKTITVSNVTVSNKVYDGTTSATVMNATLSDDDLLLGDGFSINDAHFLNANVGDYDDVYVLIELDDDAYELYQFDGNAKTAEMNSSASITSFTLGADNSSASLNSVVYEYDGEAKEPTALVKVDLDNNGTKEVTLVAGTDYAIEYANNVNVGVATATISGLGNYAGSLPALEFTIGAASVSDVSVTAPAQTYTGSALTPILTVTGTVNGDQMAFTTDDYVVAEHEDFVNAGDYTVTISAKGGSYYNIPSTNGTFTIEPRGFNNGNLSAPNSIIEGHILSPNEISVNVDGVDLVRCTNDGDTNCDYVLEISGENDGIVGHSIHVAVNGRNNYTGVGVKDINIVAKAEQTVAFNDVTGNIEKVYGDEDFTYIATTNGDGAISYSSNNESVATVDTNGKVTIHGVGEANIIATAAETDTYAEGTASYHLIVAKKTITVSNVTVSNKVYDGSPVATISGATLSENGLVYGTDFTATGLFNGVDAAIRDVNVIVALTDDAYNYYCFAYDSSCIKNIDYNTTAAILPFTLDENNYSASLDNTTYNYDGAEKKPSATVMVDIDGDGTKETNLVAGTDYEINYSNNINAGSATATITGKGNYSGSIPALEFTINSFVLTAENTSSALAGETLSYDGEAKEPTATVMVDIDGDGTKETTLNAGTDYAIDYDNNVNAGTATATISGNGNYSGSLPALEFTINKAESGEPENIPSNLAGEVGQTLAELGDLPEGFSWVDESATVAAGVNDYAATYTKNGDTNNYNTSNVTIPVLGYAREYEVVEGAGQKYTISESEAATFEINADYDLFDGGEVYVDNTLVDPSNYDSWSSSTVIQLKKDFMDGLSLGEHTLAVVFNDGGVARTTFTIARQVIPDDDDDEPVVPEENEPAAADTGVFTNTDDGALSTGVSITLMVVLLGSVMFIAKKRNSDN